jgi:hypothetical protein
MILLISASWVARITGVSHWCLAWKGFSKYIVFSVFKEGLVRSFLIIIWFYLLLLL